MKAPKQAMPARLARQLVERIILSVVLFVALMALAGVVGTLLLLYEGDKANSELTHSYEVVLELRDFLGHVQGAESAQRGYLLGGRQEFANDFLADALEADKSMQRLHDLISESPQLQDHLGILNKLYDRRIGLLQQLIDTYLREGETAAVTAMRLGEGYIAMMNLQSATDSMSRLQLSLLRERQEKSAQLGRMMMIATWIIFALTSSLLLAGAVVVHRELRMRKAMAEEALEARDVAEEAARLKARFLANMSHEIRTPMNGIIGTCSLLAATKLGREQSEFVGVIQRSSESLLAALNDILDFSKMEAGHFQLEHEPFSLRATVETALEILASRAAEKKLELLVLVEDNVPPAVMGDGFRLQQILLNLVGNAIKFTPTGEVLVTVHAREGAPLAPGDPFEVRISVKDTGIGIPAEQLPKLFDAFTQVDASTTRRYGGTGLGLAICHSLLEIMGGSLEVESTEGKGSVFSLHFPTVVAAPIAEISESKTGPLKGRRILALDDNETNLFIVRKQAESWGMESTCFSEPVKALEALRGEQAFDLALIDFHMPVLDGAEWAKRAMELRPDLPVVLLSSAFPSMMEAEEVQKLFKAVLFKPVRQLALYTTLLRLLAPGSPSNFGAATGPAIAPTHDALLGQNNPIRILLAEDDQVNKIVALRMLEMLGFQDVVWAANGAEAVEHCQKKDFDLVLMDVQMPIKDGLVAAREIRELTGNATRPFIMAVTANAMPGDRENFLAAGMNSYLSKPMKLDDLQTAIKNFLSARA